MFVVANIVLALLFSPSPPGSALRYVTRFDLGPRSARRGHFVNTSDGSYVFGPIRVVIWTLRSQKATFIQQLLLQELQNKPHRHDKCVQHRLRHFLS